MNLFYSVENIRLNNQYNFLTITVLKSKKCESLTPVQEQHFKTTTLSNQVLNIDGKQE